MSLLPVETALARILDGAGPLSAETVPVGEAAGRVLAEQLIAARTQPAFDASAMDGYALRSADAVPGARLRVVGEAAAGHALGRAVSAGEAARIFTGAPIPEGADAVLIQEDAEREGDVLVVGAAVPSELFVRRAGRDFSAGEILIQPGRRLTERDAWLIAAANVGSVQAYRRPRVAVLSIGDELAAPGSEVGAAQAIASNGIGVAALAREAGAEVDDLGIVPDVAERVTETVLAAGKEADILVTIGGASVGDHDVARPALAAAGMLLDFWKIAMRPGKPLMFGRLGDMRVLGLPGNPASSFVCSVLFLRPLIAALAGDQAAPQEGDAVLGVDVAANGDRAQYLRATLETPPDGLPIARPFADQDSALVRPMALADCLVNRPPMAPALGAGGRCRIIRL